MTWHLYHCVQYGYCISYFSDIFPALCLWLNVTDFPNLFSQEHAGDDKCTFFFFFFLFSFLTIVIDDKYIQVHMEYIIKE